MNAGAYPGFEALEMRHHGLLNDAFKRNPPAISEFTFSNLYSWREAYKFSLSALGEFIILKSNSRDKARFFDPIGKGDKKAVISTVLNDFHSAFVRIPEGTKILFAGEPEFTAELDLDNSDYLYKIADLADLSGRRYDGKRNLIKRFKTNYPHEYIELNESNATEALEFEERWCTLKNCDSVEGLSDERRAIREMLRNFSKFNLIGGAIKISGEVLAMALGERLNPSTLVMHVLKAEPEISGLYQTISREFLLRERDEFEYVNLEQDLGIAGLRRAKRSYHPVGMINKYTIKLK